MVRIALFLLVSAALVVGGDERQARAQKACAAMAKHIEAFLGPRFKSRVPVQFVDLDFIADFALQAERKMVPSGQVEASGRLAERLHQVPPGYDTHAKVLEILRKVVVGLYDPDKDRFYLVEGRAQPGTAAFVKTTAHELVHAYRDVDKPYLARTLRAMLVDSDWAIAQSCLTEGDATFLAEGLGPTEASGGDPGAILDLIAPRIALLGNSPVPVPPELKDYPLALREMVMGRYLVGLVFAARLYAEGGRKALERAFDRPPRSTEQVLHPAKYIGPEVDEPTIFSEGDPIRALGEGWKLTMANTVGEFDLRILFTEALGRERAVRVAEGWDGARLYFCEKEGVPSFVGLATTWDRESDAQEFEAAWRTWAASRDGGGKVAGAAEPIPTKDGLVVVRRRARDVFVADGVPPDRAKPVLDALAAATRTVRRADADSAK